MSRRLSATSYIRLTAAAGVALGLAWLAVSQAGSSLALERNPELAAGLGRGSIESLQGLSDMALADARSAEDFRAAERQSLEALSKAPLAQGLLRNAAIAASMTDRTTRPKTIMALADARSGRDTDAKLWLFSRSLADDDFEAAVDAMDSLLRRQAMEPNQLTQRLMARLDEPLLRQALARAMAARPLWRGEIIRIFAQTGDPAQLSDIFDLLRAQGSPPTAPEIGHLAARWVEWGEYNRGAALARQAGSPDALLTDGDFNRSGAPTPFNWVLQNQQDSYAEISPLPEGGQALRLEWRGSGVKSLTAQLLALSPGAYRFTGRVMVEELPKGAWLTWKAVCVDALGELGSARETATGPWHDMSASFLVGADCPAVWLRLEASGGLPTQRGVAWYDKLAVVRAAR